MRDDRDALSLSYLRPTEVAQLLRLSPKTVYRLASQDQTMPALRVGGSIRFPRERLLAEAVERESIVAMVGGHALAATEAGA